MDRIRQEAQNQISLEDDMNIPESKPDVSTINFEKGSVVIDEVKPQADQVNVRGKLLFSILYHTNESGGSLVTLDGKIPFDEKINLQGTDPSDTVIVDGDVEDLTIDLINSRKLSCQSVVTLNAKVEELYDEEMPVGIVPVTAADNGGSGKGNTSGVPAADNRASEESVEYRKTPMDLAQIAIDKNDIFRIKEEVSLPANYPNIYRILWNCVSLRDTDFKVLQGKINLQGDVHLFVLYEGEGEEHPVRSFETTIPFSGMLECHGCKDGMIPDIRCCLGQQEIAIRPDLDGEERNISLELTLDICIKLYEEEKVEVLSDIYGVTQEVETQMSPANVRKLLAKITGKTKVTDHIRLKGSNPAILQLLHSEGKVSLDDQTITDNGIELSGSIAIQVMYITGDDESPYASVQEQLPYKYTLEVPGIKPEDVSQIHADVEQLQVGMMDGEELDVKAILVFHTTVFQNIPVDLIHSVNVAPLDTARLGSLPGMAVYTVKPGDNLWNIGKKYYVSVASMKAMNNLNSDEIWPGQKLLIVKGT
jgi:LysM repeat protein